MSDEQFLQGESNYLVNGKRLIIDAKLLGQYGRYRAAYLMAHLACEELGKSILLRISRTSEESIRNKWRGRFTNHRDKQGMTLLAWAQVNQPEGYNQDWKAFHRRIDLATIGLMNLRNRLMYVEFDEKKQEFIAVVQDDEMKKKFKEEVKFAELLVKWVSPKVS